MTRKLSTYYLISNNRTPDEANIEFGGQTVIRETRQLKNLIVLRTFSKGFGLGKNFIRISPRLPQTNKKFLKVIDEILEE